MGKTSSHVNIGKNIINIGQDFKGDIVNNNPNEVFAKINLNGFSKTFAPPLIASHLQHKLRNDQILLIGGGFGFDKGSLLRYLAEQIAGSNQPIFEWVQTAQRQSLFSSLENSGPGVYIMQQFQPHQINYNLEQLVKIAKRKKIMVLISTDVSKKAWHLTASMLPFWTELDSSNLNYSPEFIANELVEKINACDYPLKFSNGLTKVKLTSKLPGGNIVQLAAKLTTPDQVHLFVEHLTKQKPAIDLNGIKASLSHALGKQESILHQWFHSLDPLEQYITLSMILFCDLFDDQYFGMVKVLTESEWKHSHDGLKSLDYRNIQILFNFFKYDSIDKDRRLIRNKYPNQRLDILKCAWFSHRRHIKAAVGMAVKMVVEAGNRLNSNMEVFGSSAKKEALRLTVINMLSDLGRISRSFIEEFLLVLASQDALASQNVAAATIANWRAIPGGDNQVFEILSDWQKSSQWFVAIEGLIIGRENAASPMAYLRSTIVLTIGKAASYDASNKLSVKLIELLLSFIDDGVDLVRNRLFHTVPDIIRLHANQFCTTVHLGSQSLVPLEKLVKHDDLIYPVGIGLGLAYLEDSKKTGEIIYSYLKHGQSKPSSSNQKTINNRDRLMIAMILGTSKIVEWKGINEMVHNQNSAYQLLETLRSNEKNLIIKNLLIHVIVEQSTKKRQNGKLINILLPSLSAKERDKIVKTIGQFYLEARKKQVDGERVIHVRHVDYNTWIHKERPFIPIELLLFDWLEKGSEQLKQLATLAFIEFTRLLEYEESLLRKKVLDEERKNDLETKNQGVLEVFKPAIVKGRFSVSGMFNKLVIQATRSKGAIKIINAILPIMSKTNFTNQAHKQLVIDKWKRAGEQFENIEEVAESLNKFS